MRSAALDRFGWRAGKSFLLRRLVRALGDCNHMALEEEPFPARQRFADSVAGELQVPQGALQFNDWEQALRTATGGSRTGTRGGIPLAVMSELLSGTRALRGRAELDLLLKAFDFRTAAQFHEVDDPETAFQLNAVLGGTPGYRDLLAAGRSGDLVPSIDHGAATGHIRRSAR